MDITYNGSTINFTDLFYQYAKIKEGYRNSVYKDIKGYDTIGIGHLITGNEPFDIVAGQTYSDDQVRQLFYDDERHLQVDSYAQEILDAGYSYNMALAVAHFIWGHGDGGYRSSQLRSGLLAQNFDAPGIINYLDSNWDIHSPTNQKVNREDFTVGFSSTPWQPPFGSGHKIG
jgi:GH24 family phage-related lysozyme (muramidase)